MTDADLTALEAELRHGAETLDEGSTGWPGAYKRAADAIADLRRKLDEARDVIRPFALVSSEGLVGKPGEREYASITTVAEYFHTARRWMEDK